MGPKIPPILLPCHASHRWEYPGRATPRCGRRGNMLWRSPCPGGRGGRHRNRPQLGRSGADMEALAEVGCVLNSMAFTWLETKEGHKQISRGTVWNWSQGDRSTWSIVHIDTYIVIFNWYTVRITRATVANSLCTFRMLWWQRQPCLAVEQH